ncbi:DNA mismatch repair endonuclease MutL [Pseudoxanthomonas sp. z9]|uniref:DNA mismatch repair endonuclease MutL n=1 Tax=Pseudoxanthomonas sp. z9 TaxID=2584942 RepID=UPI001142973D|nr:DNA mismatch repair endonuclease MutL [Pseudoxanthomonas sp. z9]
MPIRQLPDTLINQIAAGEVVERPASVVKELVENALDAGARRVDIDLEEGGIRLIRIRDDGGGIPAAELPLAISRHATSKIASLDDLEAVATLGFRGEALPSIASVSRFLLTSRRIDDAHGAALRADGGQLGEVAPAPHPPGTTVEVRDLFYNVPARRKFLRAGRTELGHIEEWLRSLALARPEIELRVGVDGKPARRYRPDGTDPLARVRETLGDTFVEQALRIEHAAAGLRLHGWIAQPQYSRATGDQQYLYVNGRAVRDRNIGHAAKSAYKDVLFHGRQPAYVLFLELDPTRVDVNVHPAKHEVRFRDARLIYDFVLRTLHEALAETRATMARALAMPQGADGVHALPAVAQVREARAFYEALYGEHGALPSQPAMPPLSPTLDGEVPPLGFAVAVLHGRYLLAQDAQGMVLLDLPATHRRLMLARLHAARAGIGLHAQPLLLPLELEVDPEAARWGARHAAWLASLGLSVEPAGETGLRLRAVPALLVDADPEALLRDVLAAVGGDGARESEDARVERLLAVMAGHGVPAPRGMTLAEMNALLREVERIDAGDGEAGALWRRFGLAEIERGFSRGT